MWLHFEYPKLSRTTTRERWKEIYRWERVTRKQLVKQIERDIELLAIYGATMPKNIKDDILDKIIYPPILLGPTE